MSNSILPNLDKSLAHLADKLGTSVDHLWPIVIKQAEIYRDCYLFGVGLWAMGLILSIISIQVAWKEEGETPWVILAMISGVGTLFGTIGLLSEFGNYMTALNNPEYWALHEILQQVR